MEAPKNVPENVPVDFMEVARQGSVDQANRASTVVAIASADDEYQKSKNSAPDRPHMALMAAQFAKVVSD